MKEDIIYKGNNEYIAKLVSRVDQLSAHSGPPISFQLALKAVLDLKSELSHNLQEIKEVNNEEDSEILNKLEITLIGMMGSLNIDHEY